MSDHIENGRSKLFHIVSNCLQIYTVSPEKLESSLRVAFLLCWPIYFDCSVVYTDDSSAVCVLPLWRFSLE